jgi:hypothetical protein
LHIVPGPTKHTLALVSAPPLSVHVLEPLNFFDSHSDGLTLRDRIHEYVSDEESYIKQFVRTPDGTGLAVVRETVIEACTVSGHGTILQRAGRWTAADYVVVLDGGKSTWNEAACQKLNVTLQGGPLRLFRLSLAFSHYMPRQNSYSLSLLYHPCFRSLLEALHHMNAYMLSLPVRYPPYVICML